MCGVQVPFARGGAEYLVDSLREALEARGFAAEVVNLPFKWYPSREVLSHALAWRMLDITESQGEAIDLVIATKFPSYLVRHPNKVTWLVHQFRQAYDLYGTPYNELTESSEDQGVRNAVWKMDGAALPESRQVFTVSENVSKRLHLHNGLPSISLYPPPPLGDRYRCDTYGDFVLSVGRLDAIKRVDLLLQALKLTKSPARCIITGTGPEAARLAALSERLGLGERMTFAGFVSEEQLLSLYAGCRAVFYAPYDEDYGFVTLEAMRSQKPVLTTTDAGGVLEFVRDGETGLVTAPDPPAVAAALERLMDDVDLCEHLGLKGQALVKDITWDKVVDQLVPATA